TDSSPSSTTTRSFSKWMTRCARDIALPACRRSRQFPVKRRWKGITRSRRAYSRTPTKWQVGRETPSPWRWRGNERPSGGGESYHLRMRAGVIETPRLRLTRPASSDVPEIFSRYAGDPAVTKYLNWPRHRSVGDTRAFLSW